jgi:hypothetical protein
MFAGERGPDLHDDRVVASPVRRGPHRTDAPGYHPGELVTPEYDGLPVTPRVQPD